MQFFQRLLTTYLVLSLPKYVEILKEALLFVLSSKNRFYPSLCRWFSHFPPLRLQGQPMFKNCIFTGATGNEINIMFQVAFFCEKCPKVYPPTPPTPKKQIFIMVYPYSG
jgi:hypothetical protein